MKKLIAILPALLLVMTLFGGAQAAYESDVDYLKIMVSAAKVGDYQTGRAACVARNEKIDDLGLTNVKIDFDELMLLSKIIYAEAGSNWLSDEWKMCVGEVVLNRVGSPEFPNTIAAVLAQPGQYYGANSRYFNNLIPSERCVLVAVRLLNGERLMDPSVVFQANFRQGSGTHTAVYDRYLGWTYFCYSSKPQLYTSVKATAAAVPEAVAVEDLPAEELPSEILPGEEAPVETPVADVPLEIAALVPAAEPAALPTAS